MGDYLKHCTAYTKWHTTDGETIDMDISSPKEPKLRYRSNMHWLAGPKGRLIKVLSVACVFSIGLVLGYSFRKPAHRNVMLHQNFCDLLPQEQYQISESILKKLLDSVSKENIESWLWTMTTDFHVSGSMKGSKLAHKIRDTWITQELRNVRIEKFDPLLSYPDLDIASEVRLTKGAKLIYKLKASPPDSKLETPPYSAYAPPGKVRGKPVYVNYGLPEDFNILKTRGVTLNGTIAIMRYGKTQTQSKIKRAEENGIEGVLIYGDPFDMESYDTDLDGSGPSVAMDAVERGTLKSFPGDPVTPFLPALPDMYRLPRSDIQLPGIPVHPMSAKDAQTLLAGMAGPVAPIEWQGRLNISYSIGPGYKDAAETEIQLSVYNLFREMPIHDVIGVIPGSYEPGRFVIIGCHHDSWTKGAGDPGTGMAVLMEVARMFAELLRIEGWRPKRTLIFAAWDASEFGYIGSTEFLQKHFTELHHRTVAYLSLDQAVTGNKSLSIIGSPLLRQVLSEAAEVVGGLGKVDESLYEQWVKERPLNYPSRRGIVPEIIPPASGSDFVPFYQMLGSSIAHFQFVGRDGVTDYPPLHTAYDEYDYVMNFTDPQMNAMSTLSQLIAVVALKLTDSMQLPIKVTDYSDQISTDFIQFQKNFGDFFRNNHIKLEVLSTAIRGFALSAKAFQENYESANKLFKNLLNTVQEYNERLMQLERCFLLPLAYPRHPHYRNLLYGPDNEDSTRGTLFPHLVMSIRAAQKRPISPTLNFVRENFSLVLNALRTANQILDKSLLLQSDSLFNK